MQADFPHSICKYIHEHILGHELLFLKHYFSFTTHVLCEFCSVFLCSTGLIATVCLCCPLLPPGKCIFKLYMSLINELILLSVYHVGICCVLFYMCVYWGLGISSPKNAHPGFDRSPHVINSLSQKKNEAKWENWRRYFDSSGSWKSISHSD